MIEVKLLNKGDSVLEINDKFLAIKRKNGEVDVYKVGFSDQDEFLVDPIKAAVITYGDGVVSKTSEDGETTVFTF